MMDNGNRGATPQGCGGGEPTMEAGDWRYQLPQDSRQRIVNKIMETLKKCLPVSGPDGLTELKKIAVRFEEKIYTAATSQQDYLRKISLKMLTMETKSQNTIPNSLPPNPPGISSEPPEPAPGLQQQILNENHSIPNSLVPGQSQTRQPLLSQNIQNNIPSAGVEGSTSLSSTLPPVSGLGQNTNMQSMSNVSQNSLGNPMAQATGLQQQIPNQNQSIPNSLVPSQSQIQEQLLSQYIQNNISSAGVQGSTSLSSTLHPVSGLGQNTNMQNMSNVSQDSLGNPMAQGLFVNSQRQIPGRQQVVGQQQQYLMQQQQLIKQKLQQFASQTNVSGLHQQQPLLGSQASTTSMPAGQHPVHILQQPRVPIQQQLQPSGSQGQQSQPLSMLQQMMSQIKSQPAQLQQQVNLQQQTNSYQHDMQQRIQASGSLLQSQNLMDQQKQLYQSQISLTEASSMPMDTVGQGGHANGSDWREEVCQKLNSNTDAAQGNAMNLLQQVTAGSMQQNANGGPQQQQEPQMWQSQQLKQQFQQQLLQRQQLMQKQQLLLQQQLMQKQQLLLHQQGKQQLPAQLQAHPMRQLHQMNDVKEVKVRPGMGVKLGVFQQHHVAGQCSAYLQHLKPGASFPISSPQLLQAASPQPQIDQPNLLSSLTRTGTPLQSASSPFVVPSPATPVAPSPKSPDSEKPISGVTSLANSGNLARHQQAAAAPAFAPAPSLAIGTPGILASPLLAKFGIPGAAHGNASVAQTGKSTGAAQPIERIIKAVMIVMMVLVMMGIAMTIWGASLTSKSKLRSLMSSCDGLFHMF